MGSSRAQNRGSRGKGVQARVRGRRRCCLVAGIEALLWSHKDARRGHDSASCVSQATVFSALEYLYLFCAPCCVPVPLVWFLFCCCRTCSCDVFSGYDTSVFTVCEYSTVVAPFLFSSFALVDLYLFRGSFFVAVALDGVTSFPVTIPACSPFVSTVRTVVL